MKTDVTRIKHALSGKDKETLINIIIANVIDRERLRGDNNRLREQIEKGQGEAA